MADEQFNALMKVLGVSGRNQTRKMGGDTLSVKAGNYRAPVSSDARSVFTPQPGDTVTTRARPVRVGVRSAVKAGIDWLTGLRQPKSPS